MAIPNGLLEYTQEYIAGPGQGQSISLDLLTSMISGVLGIFEEETGARLTAPSETTIIIREVPQTRRLVLPPLFTVTKLERADWPAGNNWTELGTDTWVQQERTLLRNVPLEPGFVRLTGTRGFENAADLPPSLKSGVAEVVGILYRNRKDVRPTFDSGEPGANRNLIPPHIWRTLRKYRQAATA